MPTPGTIAIIILVILILAVIVSCIQIAQQYGGQSAQNIRHIKAPSVR